VLRGPSLENGPTGPYQGPRCPHLVLDEFQTGKEALCRPGWWKKLEGDIYGLLLGLSLPQASAE
jgi:hypothetical protein